MISSAKEHIIMVLQTTLYTSLKFSKCYGGEIPICELTSELCAPGPWWLLLTVRILEVDWAAPQQTTSTTQHNIVGERLPQPPLSKPPRLQFSRYNDLHQDDSISDQIP